MLFQSRPINELGRDAPPTDLASNLSSTESDSSLETVGDKKNLVPLFRHLPIYDKVGTTQHVEYVAKPAAVPAKSVPTASQAPRASSFLLLGPFKSLKLGRKAPRVSTEDQERKSRAKSQEKYMKQLHKQSMSPSMYRVRGVRTPSPSRPRPAVPPRSAVRTAGATQDPPSHPGRAQPRSGHPTD